MSVGLDHPLVVDYLRLLDLQASQLPPGRRHELVAEIRSHVADALAAVGGDEASVRGVLDRLGAPEDIVAAEADGVPSARPVAPFQPGPVRPISAWGPLEVVAVVGLTIGAVVVPVVGPLVGLVCAWASASWTRKEKIVATAWTALAPVLIVLLGASLFIVSSSESVNEGPVVSESPAVVEPGVVEPGVVEPESSNRSRRAG